MIASSNWIRPIRASFVKLTRVVNWTRKWKYFSAEPSQRITVDAVTRCHGMDKVLRRQAHRVNLTQQCACDQLPADHKQNRSISVECPCKKRISRKLNCCSHLKLSFQL